MKSARRIVAGTLSLVQAGGLLALASLVLLFGRRQENGATSSHSPTHERSLFARGRHSDHRRLQLR